MEAGCRLGVENRDLRIRSRARLKTSRKGSIHIQTAVVSKEYLLEVTNANRMNDGR
jgi:hypothetical protein